METVAPTTLPHASNASSSNIVGGVAATDVPMSDAPDLIVSPEDELSNDAQSGSRLDILAAASATLPPNPLPTDTSATATARQDSEASSQSDASDMSGQSGTNAPVPPQPPAVEPFAWRPIPEDISQPSPSELQNVAGVRVHAIDHDHWSSTLPPQDDPEHDLVDSTHFSWTVEHFNGTQQNPNKSLVMHSQSFRLGGACWRLKLYPKGNETGYISVYLECQSLLGKSDTRDDSETAFDDGAGPSFSQELLKPILPPLDCRQLHRPRALAVAFTILMYNPSADMVHHHRVSRHLFTQDHPDAGFSRFGPGPVHDLGRRHPGQVAPILQGDCLGFIIHAQVHNNPTGTLFRDPNTYDKAACQFSRTGLLGFSHRSSDALICGPSSLFSAVMILALLAPVRSLLYNFDTISVDADTAKTPRAVRQPVITAFQEFLEDIRDAGDQNRRIDCRIQAALDRHGYAPDEDCDVVTDLMKLKCALDRELKGQSLSMESLLPSSRSRYKLPQDKLGSVRAGLKALLDAGTIPKDAFPSVMLVEIPRWTFNHHERSWKRNDKGIAINETMRLTRDSSGAYRLYACVLHQSAHSSMNFSSLIRPDMKTWYRFDNTPTTSLPIVQVTLKQATEQAQAWAYLAIYVKEDIAKSEMMEDSRAFKALPEINWKTKKVFNPATSNVERPAELRRLDRIKALVKQRANKEDNSTAAGAMDSISAVVRVKYFDPFTQKLETPHDEFIKVNLDFKDKEPRYTSFIDFVRPLISHWPANKETDIHQTPYLGDLRHGSLTKEELQAWHQLGSDRRWELLIRTETFVVQPKLNAAEKDTIISNGGLSEGDAFILNMLRRGDGFLDAILGPDSNGQQDLLGQEFHQGAFSKGEYHGKGHHIYLNGDVYNGQFRMGTRHGQGFQTFQNGDTYDGEWLSGKMHGQGTYTQAATGNTYRGTFKDGRQHAPGTTTWRVAESRQWTCYICYEKEQNAAFLECGHVCACVECARQVDVCPLCRRTVSRVQKIFLPSR